VAADRVLAAVEAEEAAYELDVLPTRHGRFDRRELTREADDPADTLRLGGHVDAGYPQLTAVGPQQRGDRADERRLACPVRPEEGSDVAGCGDKVETREGLDVAEALGEASSLDDGGHRAAPRRTLVRWAGCASRLLVTSAGLRSSVL
jgi:hypothetical protein